MTRKASPSDKAPSSGGRPRAEAQPPRKEKASRARRPFRPVRDPDLVRRVIAAVERR